MRKKVKLSHSKTSGKGKRWRKGQSSNSNPSGRKFRDAAKNRFFNEIAGPSSLTEAALAKHNESQENASGNTPMADVMSETEKLSVTAKTMNSWASNWTECTNTSFGRVLRYCQSNSALHKEILAVLAAVTEIIKTQGGKESETEYLGALMTALDSEDSEQSLAAVSYLISLVIKRVPLPVLRSRFSDIAKKLLDVLGKHADGESTSLLKSLLLNLGSLLRVQEQIVWNSSSTHQVYTSLLTFVLHPKPKVRKTAQRVVCVVLKGSVFLSHPESPPHHPAASLTAKYCMQQIEENGGSADCQVTLHILALLRDVLGTFPQHSLKSVCETILRLMTLSNVMLTACGMQALHGMFLSQPNPKSLPAELTAQIITALYEYEPSAEDIQPMRAWLAVMEEAHMRLGQLQEKLCVGHLPRLVNACITCLLSQKKEVRHTATLMLKSVFSKCLAPAAESQGPLNQPSLIKIQTVLEKGLGYQYHAAWGEVLQVFSVWYTALGKQHWKIMTKSLQTMADLRESFKFPHLSEVDMAVGCAVRSMGPKTVLQIIPLNITGDSDNTTFQRSWLLPVLHENIQNTELDYFTSYFLPLAAKLRTKAEKFRTAGHSIPAKSYETLQSQIWSLLPQFCNKPTDLPTAFPGLAKILGMALNEREDLRADIMLSLRRLILQNLEQDDSKAVLSRFAKNYLPILLNLYTQGAEQSEDLSKPSVLETVKIYLQITKPELTNSLLDKCLSRIEGSPDSRNQLLDLCIAMVPYADQSRLKNVYQLAKSHVESPDKSLQKKCYRMLEELCSGRSAHCEQFVQENLTELRDLLINSLASSGPASKAPRLKCLLHIFHHLKEGAETFLLAVLPEAILCTKEVGERARLTGYTLLLEMASTMIRCSSKSEQDVLEDYFQMTMAGLAGDPHMISATLQAQARLLYHFKGKMSDRVLDSVMENSCVLLNAKQREILQSCLTLIRVVLASFPDTRLACYLEKLVSCLVNMKEEHRRHFRLKLKEIFSRLIRKFGFENIHKMVPESYRKVLVNLRKSQERAKRKRREKVSEGGEVEERRPAMGVVSSSIDELLRDTDSELEEDEDEAKKKVDRRKAKQQPKGDEAWLMEDNPSEIMDFLDTSTTKRLMASKPMTGERKAGKDDDTFKMTSDGRLIITADQGSDEGQSEGEDDLQDLLDTFEARQKQKGQKRKLSIGDKEDEDLVSGNKYKAGGSGIHRPLGPAGKSSGRKESNIQKGSGQEYKAKKAGGDIKKKGQPDPYAYVPLQFSQLNRRKQAKLKGQFSGFVRGAKKGAAKGRKAKQKSKH